MAGQPRTGSRPKDELAGMSAGIAKKPGNAGGVKALTTFESKSETFAIWQRWMNGWKTIFCG